MKKKCPASLLRMGNRRGRPGGCHLNQRIHPRVNPDHGIKAEGYFRQNSGTNRTITE